MSRSGLSARIAGYDFRKADSREPRFDPGGEIEIFEQRAFVLGPDDRFDPWPKPAPQPVAFVPSVRQRVETYELENQPFERIVSDGCRPADGFDFGFDEIVVSALRLQEQIHQTDGPESGEVAEDLPALPDAGHGPSCLGETSFRHVQNRLIEQQQKLQVDPLLGKFLENDSPVRFVVYARFVDRPAVDQPEGVVEVDMYLYSSDEVLWVGSGGESVQPGDEKRHFVVQPGRKQTVEDTQYGVEIVERRIENSFRMFVEQIEQLPVNPDRSQVIARLQEIGRLEKPVQLIDLEPLVGTVGYQMQLAQHKVVQTLSVAAGTDLAAVSRAVFENIVELHVLGGATQMFECLVYLHLLFDQLLFADLLKIFGTQILQLGLADQQQTGGLFMAECQSLRSVQPFDRRAEKTAAEQNFRLGKTIGDARPDAIPSPEMQKTLDHYLIEVFDRDFEAAFFGLAAESPGCFLDGGALLHEVEKPKIHFVAVLKIAV